jgi:hypothetical protein
LLVVLLFFGIYILSYDLYKDYLLRQSNLSAIERLVNESDSKKLLDKIDHFSRQNLIAMDDNVDFARLDDCYLFILDSLEVLDVFEIHNSLFYSMNSNEIFTSPPIKFAGKKKIWVQDLTAVKASLQ